MLSTRLELAAARGLTDAPGEGRVAVFGARSPEALDIWSRDRVRVMQGNRPEHDALAQGGWTVGSGDPGPADMALVVLPRSKAAGRDLVARAAAAVGDGPVLIDGQKTDGVESLLKSLRGRAEVGETIAKAHGKMSLVRALDVADWRAVPQTGPEGFVTVPGVFSADGIDRASRMLADALPERLSGDVIDLGAGWGYLAARVLEREAVRSCHLVEADAAALECARRNVTDDRAVLHWADATAFTPEARVGTVVTNPPFHTGRAAEPDLGRAFIATAARCLMPSGSVWLVANRHLPYERTLADLFIEVDEAGGDAGFKILHARRPKRSR